MMFMKGEKCELRALDENDAYQVSAYTEMVNAGWTLQHVHTGSVPMRQIDVKQAWAGARKEGDLLWGVWTDNKIVGVTQLSDHRDIYKSWQFIIIIFDPSAVGIGIGKEVTRLVVNYAFQRLNSHRVWLGVNAENLRAVKTYLDVGFKVEGTLRDEIFCFGHYCDVIRMGVLENEWKLLSSVKAPSA